MNPQFSALTRHEMFFGITPKINLSSGGVVNSTELISKVATTPVNTAYITTMPHISINSDVILPTDFISKYKWEIGIISILVVGGIIWYAYSLKESEEKKRIG